jgi:hypothetical protein
MRFYTRQHLHYCGIDLHARTMYLCFRFLRPPREVLKGVRRQFPLAMSLLGVVVREG